VPLVPAAVRRRPVPAPLTIKGDAWVPAEVQSRAEVSPLTSGVAVESNVAQSASKFYSIGAMEGRRLTIRLYTYSGDPDVYVSMTEQRPDAERYTWRSLSGGAVDELHIDADDPRVLTNGTYYICVYSGRQSDYKLIAELSKPPIALPPRPTGGSFEHGFKELGRALRASAARINHAAAGGSSLGSLSDTLEARGQHAEQLIAAGRPAAAALRSHSTRALKSGVRREVKLSLSRSLNTLVQTHDGGDGGDGGGGGDGGDGGDV